MGYSLDEQCAQFFISLLPDFVAENLSEKYKNEIAFLLHSFIHREWDGGISSVMKGLLDLLSIYLKTALTHFHSSPNAYEMRLAFVTFSLHCIHSLLSNFACLTLNIFSLILFLKLHSLMAQELNCLNSNYLVSHTSIVITYFLILK